MTGRGAAWGGRFAVLLAVALAAVLTAGPPAQARMPRPPAASVAEEHVECGHQHEAQVPTGRAAGRHRANGGPPARTGARPDEDAATGVPRAPLPAGPVPAAGGSRPAALARIQVFRC
ncbi:hypothetical protein [Kitasatospora setae]|uniref:hypothetical protein n=1 Tax=Kitasatospora setae TaxID=2066 RepID=UPI000524E6B1|nr:hypothetical protein [Kitasatospora setae]